MKNFNEWMEEFKTLRTYPTGLDNPHSKHAYRRKTGEYVQLIHNLDTDPNAFDRKIDCWLLKDDGQPNYDAKRSIWNYELVPVDRSEVLKHFRNKSSSP